MLRLVVPKAATSAFASRPALPRNLANNVAAYQGSVRNEKPWRQNSLRCGGGLNMRKTFYILKSPGSKCWLFPNPQKFLGELRPKTIVEPYAGSAVVSLTLLNHGYT